MNLEELMYELNNMSEDEFKKMEDIATEQIHYSHPFKIKTVKRQHELGRHNIRVLKKLRELKEELESGANI